MEETVFTKENEFGARERVSSLFSETTSLHPKLRAILNFEEPRNLKIKNVIQLLNLGRSVAGDGANFLGERTSPNSVYDWLSFGEFDDFVCRCATGITNLGIPAGNDVHIATYSKMSKKTFIVIFTAFKRRNVIVPLYDSLGKPSIEHIIHEADPTLAFCDTEDRVNTLLEIPGTKIKHILTSFNISAQLHTKANSQSVTLVNMEDLMKTENIDEFNESNEPELDDLMYILYTSGSTGIPKGVKLCHRQFVFNVIACIRSMGAEKNPAKLDKLIYYSYLPYQHSFENITLLLIMSVGAQIGISQGDLKLLPSDLNMLKPNLMIAVPRVLDRFREKIFEGVSKSNFIMKYIFNWAFERRKAQLLSDDDLPYSMFYNFIFRKVHAQFGGNLEYLIVAGAPMSKDIEVCARVLFGAQLVQGYGLTETTAATMLQNLGNRGLGEAGIPMAGIEIKLVDEPDFGYFSSDGVGELCVRGPNVTPGYYNRPELNKEIFDEDGFFRSGDIARLNKNGTYSIIDRSKNMFKLSQGEYIMPEKIEAIYSRHPLVKQIMLYGDSTKDYPIALIIVGEDQLVKFAKNNSIFEDALKLLENRDVKTKFIAELNKLGKEANLLGFEQVRGLLLDYKEFTIDNELLTPTMKVRRVQVTKLYIDALKDVYNSK